MIVRLVSPGEPGSVRRYCASSLFQASILGRSVATVGRNFAIVGGDGGGGWRRYLL